MHADDKQIRDFWNYVKENEMKIINASNQDVLLWNELNGYLQTMDELVHAMVFRQTDTIYLVITSGGNKYSFNLCDEIVRKAPPLEKMKAQSLIPASENVSPFIYQMGGETIYFTVDDVSIHCDDFDSDNIGLLILLSAQHLKIISDNKEYDMENFYYNLCIQMMMQVLGERLMADKIAKIELMPLNLIMPAIPLKKLPDFI